MSSLASVTLWIDQVKKGDHEALQKLWERFFHRLVGLARKKLEGVPRRAADAEDVAGSAFVAFWQGVERGQFPLLFDRDDLWHLLAQITVYKASNLRAREQAQKRGGGVVVRGDS
ncbi:MAG: ECF-type sigma factor, partial [Gemmataceae bacterium]|nr:ECF-type sigma factor [Gemmataceae bacterium]